MLDHIDLTKLIFGRLSWDAIPYHEPILIGTFCMVALGGLALLAVLTKFKMWGPLWTNWVTSIDHKKIGIMYMVLGLIMLMRGFTDALMMRTQQAFSFGDNAGFLPPHHYDQVFTAHGVIMIFYVANIVGDKAEVVPLIPAGFNPHAYEPRAALPVAASNGTLALASITGMSGRSLVAIMRSAKSSWPSSAT